MYHYKKNYTIDIKNESHFKNLVEFAAKKSARNTKNDTLYLRMILIPR